MDWQLPWLLAQDPHKIMPVKHPAPIGKFSQGPILAEGLTEVLGGY